jgi:hypothetical protein
MVVQRTVAAGDPPIAVVAVIGGTAVGIPDSDPKRKQTHMKRHRFALLATLAIACGYAPGALAQDNDEAPAITARVHGTFLDKAGGVGVLSGDMNIVRFELRNGTVMAIGRIVGALADSAGDVLGQVDHELALPVGNVASTCNQLRMDLAPTDAEVLQTMVHFDAEVAGFDSRDGATPKALGVLCAAGELLRGKPPAPRALAGALEAIAVAVRSR